MTKPKRDKKTGRYVAAKSKKAATMADELMTPFTEMPKAKPTKKDPFPESGFYTPYIQGKTKLPKINKVQVAPAEGSAAYHANAAALSKLTQKLEKAGVPIYATKAMSFEEAQKALKKYASKDKTPKKKTKATKASKEE